MPALVGAADRQLSIKKEVVHLGGSKLQQFCDRSLLLVGKPNDATLLLPVGGDRYTKIISHKLLLISKPCPGSFDFKRFHLVHLPAFKFFGITVVLIVTYITVIVNINSGGFEIFPASNGIK